MSSWNWDARSLVAHARNVGACFCGVAAVLGAIALTGCGGDEVGSDGKDVAVAADSAAGSDMADGGGTADGDGGGLDAADSGGTPVSEAFWVVYGRRNRLAGAKDSDNDVILANWKNPGAIQNAGTFGIGASPLDPSKPAIELTKYSFKQAGSLNCNFGCVVSPDLRFMAIATGTPKSTGFTYQPAVVNQNLEVFVSKFQKLEKVAHLQFAGDYLFYSTQANCLGTGKCQYDLHRLDLSGAPGAGDEVLTKMAPDADPDIAGNDTTYDGYFRVSADASSVVFLTPTIRSVKVYVWRGGNVSKLDYVCANPQGDTCVGTGSEYSDRDPLAVSADGNTVVFFSIVDRWLRVRRYLVGSEEAAVFSNLVEVPSGKGYLGNACSILKPWQHVQVAGNPTFSADGKLVYLLGSSRCGATSDKPWTDLMSLPVARIGQTIGAADWLSLTKNPRDNSTKNKRIFDFAMSPAKQVFLVSATATFQADGKPIPDGQDRSLKDSEIYTMAVGSGELVPITNELKYAADSPFAVSPVKP